MLLFCLPWGSISRAGRRLVSPASHITPPRDVQWFQSPPQPLAAGLGRAWSGDMTPDAVEQQMCLWLKVCAGVWGCMCAAGSLSACSCHTAQLMGFRFRALQSCYLNALCWTAFLRFWSIYFISCSLSTWYFLLVFLCLFKPSTTKPKKNMRRKVSQR